MYNFPINILLSRLTLRLLMSLSILESQSLVAVALILAVKFDVNVEMTAKETCIMTYFCTIFCGLQSWFQWRPDYFWLGADHVIAPPPLVVSCIFFGRGSQQRVSAPLMKS